MKPRLAILAAAAVLAAVSLASCRKVSLGDIEDRLDKVERTVYSLSGVNEQISAINASIVEMNAVIAELKSSSTGSPAQVQAAIAALEARIAALEQLQGSLATRDWAEATFATLDAQAQTAADLARVQAVLNGALTGLPEGKSIAEAIAAASQSVRSWMGEQLAGYYTIGQLDGKLAAMKTELEAKVAALDAKADSLDSALTAEIEAAEASIAVLSAALESAKAAITTACTAAINAAKAALEQDIADLDGKITVNTDAINAANSKIGTLEGKVAALELEIDALKTRLTTVENDVAQLKGMVQSVVFVPKYEGGCAVVRTTSDLNSLTLEYEVFPQTCASAIATAWLSDNSILALNSRTVLTRSGLASIPITDVTYNDESKLLEVSVKLDGVPGVALSSGAALAVSLTINTGTTTVSSPFSDIVMPRIVDLSAGGTANCYIVKEAGEYKFNAKVRGNGKTTDGNAADAIDLAGATAQVLWESFGTADTPAAGSLVNSAVLDGTNVLFTATSNTGNAVIAVKDAGGNILWSWHIWLAGGQPLGQAYNNNAGTMMDRNLGATSAEKGNPGALGLFYQWGRKDPFLGSSEINSGSTDKTAKSAPNNIIVIKTASECLDGESNNLEYSIAHPTVFLTNGSTPWDWYCTDASNRNDDLWKSTDASSPKTMYDPCPPGYRVPDGGDTGVWKKAGFDDTSFDSTYRGMSFSTLQDGGTTWYPAAGFRDCSDGTFFTVGSFGYYWSCTVYGSRDAYYLDFNFHCSVYPLSDSNRAYGFSVRCLSESR